jgi:hypothetical protein
VQESLGHFSRGIKRAMSSSKQSFWYSKSIFFHRPQPRQGAYGMHRLVRLPARTWLEYSPKLTHYGPLAMRLLAEAFPHHNVVHGVGCTIISLHAQALLDAPRSWPGDIKNHATSLLKYSRAQYFLGPCSITSSRCREAVAILAELFNKRHPRSRKYAWDTPNKTFLQAVSSSHYFSWVSENQEAEPLVSPVLQHRMN